MNVCSKCDPDLSFASGILTGVNEHPPKAQAASMRRPI